MTQEIFADGAELVRNLETNVAYITGEKGGGKGGGGGSSRSAIEDENTLRSAAVVKVVEVISEGPIVGICGGAKGILINNTPLQNASGSYNFPRVMWDYRTGLPVQDYMPGFASASAEISVNAPVLASTPVIRTTTAANIDAVKVSVLLPQGLASQDITNGDLHGSSVTFRVDIKLTSSGSWQTYGSYTITGKTTSPYEAQYRVERPYGAGTWDVRVVRETPDSTTAALKNLTTFSRITEIIDVKLGYEDTAVIGLAIDAESVGSQIPVRAYMVKGRILSVPANYNPETRVYTGIWNGTFQQAWSDNPAWVLYDLMTHERYGMGEFISPADIDIYSFYDAAVYNDELVPDGKGGQEPRFTFSANIVTQEDAGRLLQLVAGSFRASLKQINGKWTVLQDRPSAPVRDITNSNVKDGRFVYKSTGLFERYTAINVAWNDRSDRYLQVVTPVEDAEAIARYGYVPNDIAAYGATTEGQAIRMGKWALDTVKNQTEVVSFVMGLNGFDMLPNDVFNLYDEDYTGIAGAGRIVSVSGVHVTLDKPVTLVSGTTITVLLSDGHTRETRNIVQTSGTVTEFDVDSAFSQTVSEKADYVVITTVQSRQFKVMNLRFPNPNEVEVEALYHDPTKFARIELGISVQPPPFSDANRINSTVVAAPTDLNFMEEAVRNADGSVTRNLLVSWVPATVGSIATSFLVRYSREGAAPIDRTTAQTQVSIPVDADGVYTVIILAFDGAGRMSGTSLKGTHEVSSSTSGVLGAVQNLYVHGTTDYIWDTDDLTVSWAVNPANVSVTQDYEVVVLTAGDVELRRETVTDLKYTYTITQNRADHMLLGGQPSPIIKIKVTPRDLFSRSGVSVSITCVNQAPASPMGLMVYAGIGAATVQWERSPEPDVAGYLVWRGTAPGFTPSAANLVFDGLATSFTESDLADSTTYYYRVAAYDTFHRDVDGTGMILSGEGHATTSSGANVNEYQLTGMVFTANDPATNSVSWTTGQAYQSLGVDAGTTWSISAGSAAWTSGVLYIYYEAGDTALSHTTSLPLAVGDTKVIVATYRGGTNLEVGYGRAMIDGSMVLAGTIGASQIAAGSIGADQIAAGSITADKLDVGTLSANQITLDSVGYIRGGQTAYNTGAGFWLGYAGTTYKFSLGNSTSGITWDGSAMTIKGDLTAGSINLGGKFTADNNGSISIKSGTSGARLEITNDCIKVYDASNVLRVKIGNLA